MDLKRTHGARLAALCALVLVLGGPGSILLAVASTTPTEPSSTTTTATTTSTTASTTQPEETTEPTVTTTQPVENPEPTVTTTQPVENPESTTTTAPPVTTTETAPDPTATIAIAQTTSGGSEASASSGTIHPGDSFEWQITATCTSVDVGCVDLTVVDTFPTGLVIDEGTIPESIPGYREVTWDGSTLTVLYLEPLANPAGGTGLVAGESDSFNIRFTLPSGTDLARITNEATISAANAVESATDQSTVEVLTPPVIGAQTTETTEPGFGILLTPDPTGTISIDKTNTADGEPASDGGTVEPGDPYTYNFLASCTSINVDCVDLTLVDVFPADVVVDEATIPPDIAGFRDVTYDAATQTLTVVYIQDLDNPPGETGKLAGSSDSFEVSVTLPADTLLETGSEIPNDATVTSFDVDGNPIQATDPSPVVVNVPRTVDVETSKSFSDPSAIAGDPEATTTIQLAADNLSSTSAEVTEMMIEDSTADTFEYLDFVSATVTDYPEGADQAQLFVCPSANAPCDSDDDYVAAGTGTPPEPTTLDPAPTDPSDIIGVRVVFTDTDGTFIEPVANGGTAAVHIEMDLRDTVRSTDQPIVQIPTTTTIDNTATSTVTDPGADPSTATDDATAQYQILPPTLNLDPSKSFFADENANFQTDSGEHAVIGENSGVSMLINAENISAFPIAEIVITEPSPVVASEFDKFDADSIQLTFPAGAANANVVVNYEDGTATDTDYAAPGPGIVELHPPDSRVTSISVIYTGPDTDPVDGEPDPTIEPGAVAGLGVHGNLNDNVDVTDVADGIDNCANFLGSGGGVPGTTGTFEGDECTNLDVEDRNAGTGGTKTASQAEIPPDQPIAFRMSTENTGNLPLFDVVVTDPPPNPDGTPPLTPTFENMRFLDAVIENDDVDAEITIEVFIPGTGWVAYPGTVTDAQRALVTGVRASTDVMTPTESFDLVVGMQLRFFANPETEIENCYNITGADSADVVVDTDHCSPPLTPTDLSQAATLNKFISPETVPERIPGMDPADSAATVQLRVQNTGSLTAQFLQITDNDTDFWDAVDFASLGEITPPATGANLRADLIQIDAFVDGAWVNGTPSAIGSAALPGGVTAEEVRGLRFTFSSTLTVNDGYVITPCNEDPLGGCAGVVEFVVEPRLSLLSTGEPLPETLEDTATGSFQTQLTGTPTGIPPVIDDLTFVPGDPALDVNKTPENATVQPGQLATFDLVTTNTGTANLPDVTVSDPIPVGILFDDTFADPDTDQPFTVTWSNLPDGYPEPPDPVFETSPDPADPTRVGMLRWTFPGFDMPPNSTVTILYRYTLEPGVTAGQEITNTMGASSPVDDLVCSDVNDGVVVDGEFGEGTYCTDPANVTVTAGANFASRKWVAGNPDLGWYNEATGELVPIGAGGCLSLETAGRTYTTNPCIAIVNPGEQFHYVLRVQNAGTENALEMTIVDTFPAPGDTGVFGADRGTQWATAPTLDGPATYVSDFPDGSFEYTTDLPCAGGAPDWPCDDATWTDSATGATALRMNAAFDPDPLPPGGTVDVLFSMNAPVEVPRVSDPTVAYNSLAHGEVTDIGNGNTRSLAPLEPLKVGVATLYGNLEVVKEIGENPANLPLEDVPFTFMYECTISTGAPGPSGIVVTTPNSPGLVTEIPSGSTCAVWEIGPRGFPSATPDDPVEVLIEPSLDPETPVVSTATVTNDFPFGAIEILKITTGGTQPEFTPGPYLASVDCRFELETVPGFPVVVELFPDQPVSLEVPVGSVCTVVEIDQAGASTVTYDPAAPNGAPGAQAVVPANETATASVEITNEYEVGSLVIVKEVSGPGVPEFSGGPFVFDVTCDYLDSPAVFSTEVVVPGSEDGSPVESDPVTGLPVGAVCTVTETDSAGADIISPPQTVTIEANEEENVSFVGVNNPFSAGTVAVAKQVEGEAAGSDYVSLLSYTVAVECAIDSGDGEPVPVLSDEVTVSGDGVPVTVSNEDGSPTLIPVGARCWASEATSGGATSVSIDHDSYETGIEVVADAEDGVQELLITVTNVYDPAILRVSKAVVNEADPDAVYTFTIECTIEDTDGAQIPVPLLTGESPVSLGAGEVAAFTVLSGSTCVVTETTPGGGFIATFTETGGVDDADPDDGVITVGSDASVGVVNTFDSEAAGGAGALPFTGASAIAVMAAIAAILVGTGVVLRARARNN